MPAFERESGTFSISNRWMIFSVASLLYLLSMFYRSSITVIAPNLMAEPLCPDRLLPLATGRPPVSCHEGRAHGRRSRVRRGGRGATTGLPKSLTSFD